MIFLSFRNLKNRNHHDWWNIKYTSSISSNDTHFVCVLLFVFSCTLNVNVLIIFVVASLSNCARRNNSPQGNVHEAYRREHSSQCPAAIKHRCRHLLVCHAGLFVQETKCIPWLLHQAYKTVIMCSTYEFLIMLNSIVF